MASTELIDRPHAGLGEVYNQLNELMLELRKPSAIVGPDGKGKPVPGDVLRTVSLAITKVEEADLWLSKARHLGQLRGVL